MYKRQPLHSKCSFANYQVQNDGQKYALSQAKSIADELMTGCTNFVFSGKTGTGKNHLAAAMGNRLMVKAVSYTHLAPAPKDWQSG